MALLRSKITGVGSFVPPKVVTNDELSKLMNTSDEWIRQRTGIEQRHWVEGTTTTTDLALQASRNALEMAGIEATDLDMILMATLSPDHEFPGAACFLQSKLDVPGIPAIDIRQQCSGFVYASSIADKFIRLGECKKVLVCGAEVHSKSMDISDTGRDITVLFGDGAGAVVMEAVEVEDPLKESCVLSTHLHADGRHAKELWIEAPTQTHDGLRLTHEMIDKGLHFPYMNGKKVYVHASRRMPEAVLEACQANGVALDEIDLFLFHQANLRINEQVARQLGADPEKCFNTIQKYANTTAATIPIGMDEAVRAGVLTEGMLVVCSVFGSGFTWASMLLRW